MQRWFAAILALSLAGLACAMIPGEAPTAEPGTFETAVAATLTALAPTGPAPTVPAVTVPAVTETSEVPGATETPTATLEATAANTPDAPPAALCPVVYADGATLFCLGAGGTPQMLAAAPAGLQIWDPAISPDGQRVAFNVGILGSPSELWVVGADPALNPPHILVTSANVPSPDPANVWFPRRFAWRAGTHSLFFDTGWQPVGGIQGPGEYINNDLWSADADSGSVALVLGEQVGGNYAVSPNGQFVGFSYPTGLGLVNADGSNLRRDLVTFPSILTYSEYFLKPDIYWNADSLSFSAAVPSMDPMAPDPSATLYRVGTDGIVQTLATVPGNFVFGGLIKPMFSPDGQRAAYSQLQPGSSQTEDIHLLHLAVGAITDAIVDVRDAPGGWGWSPDSQHFVYGSTPGGVPGSGYSLAVDGTVAAWAPGLSSIIDLEWQDPSTFYFIGQINAAAWSLYRQALGAEPVLLLSGLPQRVGLDVRPAP